MAHARSPSKRGDAKSETMRVSLLKSVDGRSRRRGESIVCVSPFFSLSCFTRHAPPWSLGWPPRSRSQLARSFGVLVPVGPRSIAAGSTDASWRLCLAYVQVYKLLFGESRLSKRGKGFEPGAFVRASSWRAIGEGRCRSRRTGAIGEGRSWDAIAGQRMAMSQSKGTQRAMESSLSRDWG